MERIDTKVVEAAAEGRYVLFSQRRAIATELLALRQSQERMYEALKAAEKAEAALIAEWADFWDVAPQALIDELMKAQALRNTALAGEKE